MLMPFIAGSIVLVAGMLAGFLAFSRVHRALPRWMRVAMLMMAMSWLTGGALYFAAHLLSPLMSRPLVFVALLVCGMGMGICLLLTISGEYFRALRNLDAAGRKRSQGTPEKSGHE